MLVLEVWLTVVACNPLGVGRRRRLHVRRCNLTMEVVVPLLEETTAHVEVTDRVDWFFELDGPGVLAIPMRPVMFNPFHVPLVNHNYNLFAVTPVDLVEQIIIPVVNKNLLQMREVRGRAPNVPVHQVPIKTLLWKRRWSRYGHLRIVGLHLRVPVGALQLDQPLQVLGDVKPCLVKTPVDSGLIKFLSNERKFWACFLCGFASVFHFETWDQGGKVVGEAVVPVEDGHVDGHSREEDDLPWVVVDVEVVPEMSVVSKRRLVVIEFFLRFDILEKLSPIPPVLA